MDTKMDIKNEDSGCKIKLTDGREGTFLRKAGGKNGVYSYIINLKDGAQVSVYERQIAQFWKGVPGWK